MRVAVIILNYNSSDDCRKCISFLKRQQMVDLEIIVVDNNSSDGDKVRVLCEQEKCTFIQSRENRGYNAGNNIGLRYAAEKGYEYALIANPDMEFPESDYVLKLVSEMNQNTDIVVVGSSILTPEGKHQNPKKRENLSWLRSFDWLFNFFSKKKKNEWVDKPEISHFCRSVNGCCFLIKIAFLKSINFFDEDTFLYGEEPILGRQVELSKKKLYYTSRTYAVHNHIKSKEGSDTFRFKYWKKSMIIYVNKYSHLSFIEKLICKASIHCYFFCLSIFSKIRKKI